VKADPFDDLSVEPSAEPPPYLRLATGTIAQQAEGSVKTLPKEVSPRQFLYLGIGERLPQVKALLLNHLPSQAESEGPIEENIEPLFGPLLRLDSSYGPHG